MADQKDPKALAEIPVSNSGVDKAKMEQMMKMQEMMKMKASLKDSYQPWEYFVAPSNPMEYMHRFNILKRKIFNEDIKGDPSTWCLRQYLGNAYQYILDIQKAIRDSASLQTRYYSTYAIMLSVLILARKRRIKKLWISYVATSIWIYPEHIAAVLNAK